MMKARALLSITSAGFLLTACAGPLPGGMLLTGANMTPDGQAGDVSLASSDNLPPLPERRGRGAAAVSVAQNAAEEKTVEGGNFMGSLASLIPSRIEGGPPAPSETAYSESDPTTVYARIAGEIKSCWLNRSAPVLADHKFHAEASPAGEASITIYKKVEGAALGVATFRIKIAKDGSGTLVRSENVKLPDSMKLAMLTDVAAWVRGQSGCKARSASIPGKTATP